MRFQRISSYRVMMIMVLFDLPTLTKTERKKANRFRINLKKLGYRMMQLSVYIKNCYGIEDMESEIKKVERILEDTGEVCVLTITEKQYNNMKYYFQKHLGNVKIKSETEQLMLF
ncbi:MAG: CRISPR-associated endonuclease Cas2 [Bacteroidota bacterium]